MRVFRRGLEKAKGMFARYEKGEEGGEGRKVLIKIEAESVREERNGKVKRRMIQ